MSQLSAGAPLSTAGVTLVPIESVSIYKEKQRQGFWAYGSKEPVAFVICDTQGFRVINLGESEVSLESLQRKVPHLDSVLTALLDSRS